VTSVRFGWLGKSRREALAKILSIEVSQWSKEWWLHDAPSEVDVRWIAADGADLLPKGSMPFVSSQPTGSIAVFLGGKDFDAIGRHLVGATETEEAGWAQRIGEEALNDLVLRICRRSGNTMPSKLVETLSIPAMERADLGCSTWSIVLGRLKWHMVVDRHLADQLVPIRAQTNPPLVSRKTAIEHQTVRVDALINFGSINLTHLSDLRVGEILVGDGRLDETVQIQVKGHGVVAHGYLRSFGTQRAVVLDSDNAKEF